MLLRNRGVHANVVPDQERWNTGILRGTFKRDEIPLCRKHSSEYQLQIDVGDELVETSERCGGNAEYILTSEGRSVDVTSSSSVIFHRNHLPMSAMR